MKRWIPFLKSDPVVAILRLSGVIGTGARAGALNDATLGPVIEKAFRRGKPKAVALLINSPGGSPVQSSLIAARIQRLSQEKQIPVYAFVEDVAASGGYWLATAADEIWIDANSIVGSIGVISAGFGLKDMIGRYGIKRRVYTAGKSKSMMDPFQDEKPEDIARLKAMLEQIHENFKTQVSTRRKGKLPVGQDLFTGDIWVGEAARRVGLVDGVGHLEPKMKEIFGTKLRFRRYGVKRSIFQRFGAQVMTDAIDIAEERAQYARFGL